jgi:hypothetical protein
LNLKELFRQYNTGQGYIVCKEDDLNYFIRLFIISTFVNTLKKISFLSTQ